MAEKNICTVLPNMCMYGLQSNLVKLVIMLYDLFSNFVTDEMFAMQRAQFSLEKLCMISTVGEHT